MVGVITRSLSRNAVAGTYQSGSGEDIYNLQEGYRQLYDNSLDLKSGAGNDIINVNASLKGGKFYLQDGNNTININEVGTI